MDLGKAVRAGIWSIGDGVNFRTFGYASRAIGRQMMASFRGFLVLWWPLGGTQNSRPEYGVQGMGYSLGFKRSWQAPGRVLSGVPSAMVGLWESSWSGGL